MPYPEDPFALKLKIGLKCPKGHRPLIRETADKKSPYMGQVRCEQCGFIGTFDALRESNLEGSK
jgi:hypothetical protein